MGGRAVLGVLLAAFCTTAPPVFAQTTGVTTGSIVGVVTDSTGGTLPGRHRRADRHRVDGCPDHLDG